MEELSYSAQVSPISNLFKMWNLIVNVLETAIEGKNVSMVYMHELSPYVGFTSEKKVGNNFHQKSRQWEK